MPEVPPVTSPVPESITTLPPGFGFKVKIPPAVPVIAAVPPSQVAVILKLAFSVGLIVTKKLISSVQVGADSS